MNKRDQSNIESWQCASMELVRALRGKRSQRHLSQRLGYRGKPVADWESGRRFPTAAATLKVCLSVGVDVGAALRRFAPHVSELRQVDDDGVARWLRDLRGQTTIVELAGRCRQPRFSVSRWLSGHNRPRLPQFLALVEAMTGRASDLVAGLVDIDKVPSLAPEYHRRQRARRLAFEKPWSAAVLRVLETHGYEQLAAHSDGWLAAYLRLDVDTVRDCVRELAAAGLIARRDDKYLATPATVDTRLLPAENRRIKAHWAHTAAGRADQPDDADLFAYNVISVSRADLDKIDGMLRSCFREIRSLVSASTPAEDVALVQLQLLTWQQPGPDVESAAAEV